METRATATAIMIASRPTTKTGPIMSHNNDSDKDDKGPMESDFVVEVSRQRHRHHHNPSRRRAGGGSYGCGEGDISYYEDDAAPERRTPSRSRCRGAKVVHRHRIRPPPRLMILLAVLLAVSVFVGATDASDAASPSSSSFSSSSDAAVVGSTCPVGFGGGGDGAATTELLITIEPSMINDNYCDCPTTGMDEPLTNACSGHRNWSGLGSAHIKDDAGDDDDGSPSTFVCPQQPNLKLSASKLNDGICDCCCGSDEPTGDCEDVCDQVLAEERRLRKELQTSFRKGSKLRLRKLQEFEQKRTEVQAQVNDKQVEVAKLQEQVVEATEQVRHAKVNFFQSRHQRLEEVARDSLGVVDGGESALSGLFGPLTTPELLNLVVHACQVAGEMQDDDNKDAKTCLPLRLAGLDAGIVWKHLTYDVARIRSDEDSDKVDSKDGSLSVDDVAEMLHMNVRDPSSTVYNVRGLQKKRGTETAASTKNRNRRERERRRHRRPRHDSGDDEDEDFYDEDFDEDDDVVAGDRDAAKPIKSSSDDDDDDSSSDEAKNERKKNRKAESERFHAELRQRPLGKVQHTFLEQSQSVLDRMNAVLDDLQLQDEEEKKREREQRRKEMERRRKERAKKKKNDEDGSDPDEDGHDSDDDDDEPDAEVTSSDESPADQVTKSQVEALPENFDPVALPIARDALASRQSLVQRGYQYAVSAKILLDALLESYNHSSDADDGLREQRIRQELSMLAVGTLAHGRLSAVQVWQIYQGVVDGLVVEGASLQAQEDDPKTCQSPWTALCPPRSIERTVQRDANEAVTVTIPPKVIRQAASAFCDEQMALLASNAESCLSMAVDAADLPIPSSIPEGYLGYVPPKPRQDDDPLAAALASLDLKYLDEARKELDDQEEREKQLESDQNRIQDDIRDLTDSIGLDDPSKYGDSGELYALKDQCFSHDTGKYVYEICLFGNAKQKEGKGGGGTDLGRWTGTSVDEDTGHRLWKWENGQRCWNGPNRSATARVTCGASTRVVSVDEPEMCKYVLEVESYIACDDEFAAKHGLESA